MTWGSAPGHHIPRCFSLFAIFSVVRYRTVTMSPREMTYLFFVTVLPVLNSVVMRGNNWSNLLAVNATVVAVLFALERERVFILKARS